MTSRGVHYSADASIFTPATNANDSAQTITAANVATQNYERTGLTTGRTDTLDTGTNICGALIPLYGASGTTRFSVDNKSAFPLTVGNATGVTLSTGATDVVAAFSRADYTISITSATTVTFTRDRSLPVGA